MLDLWKPIIAAMPRSEWAGLVVCVAMMPVAVLLIVGAGI
jgi:hypothetical protein